jgi:hypothetical protein
MSTQQLANNPQRTYSIKTLAEAPKVREQLIAALPKHFTADQFAVIVRISTTRSTSSRLAVN